MRKRALERLVDRLLAFALSLEHHFDEATAEHGARDREQDDAPERQDGREDAAAVRDRHNVAVAERRDGLDGPPRRDANAREDLGLCGILKEETVRNEGIVRVRIMRILYRT